MAQTYVLYAVASYSQNMSNELKKSKKYYLFDLGIRNSLLKDFGLVHERDDSGSLYESAVLQQLVCQLKPNAEIRFWRTKKGFEVDFILLKNRVPVPIEVKATWKEKTPPKGMAFFLKRYPKAPFGFVFNQKFSADIIHDGRPVYVRPWTNSAQLAYLKEIV